MAVHRSRRAIAVAAAAFSAFCAIPCRAADVPAAAGQQPQGRLQYRHFKDTVSEGGIPAHSLRVFPGLSGTPER